MSPSVITVPDLTGLTFSEAYRIGTGAGVEVIGLAPDGREVGPESEGAVVEQDPMAGAELRVGGTLLLRVGRPPGGAGDRAPEPVPPVVLEGDEEADPTLLPGRRDTDPDSDPDLVPA
jgi:beta-lactam-binding protein with PASTA domain